MAERSKASHSRCDVATLVGSNPTLCIFYFYYFRSVLIIILHVFIIVSQMDIFQLFGDFLHLMAVLLLVLKILANRNVVGNYS